MPLSTPRRFRFGIQLQAQRTTWPEYIAAVKVVEDLGFDTVWNFEHMLPFSGDPNDSCFETLTTLTAMATQTQRIRIGTLVNGVLYRDPATLAKSAAMIDIISNGRLEFSLGGAWAEREFHAYGLPFPSFAERAARLDEALHIVKALWTQARTSYVGRYYRLTDAPLEPKPVQKPHPPIMVGGNGRSTLRIAARHADVWNGVATPEKCAELIAILHQECASIGRDPADLELSAHPNMAIARDRDAAVARARAAERMHGLSSDETSSPWLLGTPAEIRSTIQRYRDAGITHLTIGISPPFDLDGLRLFADEVIPAFR